MTICRPTSLIAKSLLTALMVLPLMAHSQTAAPATVAIAASQTPALSTFTKLVQQAGLEAALQGAGPVTAFAPTDEAFKAVPAATLDKLAKDPEFLKYVLSYHLVPTAAKSSELTGNNSLVTMSGAKVTVARAGDFVTVDDALVTKADIVTGNGVLHIIDQVLTPPKK